MKVDAECLPQPVYTTTVNVRASVYRAHQI